MTSEKQVMANQNNAQKSTGPLSEQGKAVVAQNALKHGILSTKVPIDEEERSEYNLFAAQLSQVLAPTDEVQSLLADRIISSAWRLRRIIHVEALLLGRPLRSTWSMLEEVNYSEAFVGSNGQSMAILSKYERSLENALFRAMKELRDLQELNTPAIQMMR